VNSRSLLKPLDSSSRLRLKTTPAKQARPFSPEKFTLKGQNEQERTLRQAQCKLRESNGCGLSFGGFERDQIIANPTAKHQQLDIQLHAFQRNFSFYANQ